MKKQYVKLIILSVGLMLASLAMAAPNSSPTAANNLINIFNKTNVISAKFKQEVKDSSGQIIATSTGTMIIQRPNRFRWDTQTPMAQLAIADGQQVWFYQPDLEQVTISKMTHEIGQTPLAILSGSTASLQQNFAIDQTKPNEFILTARKNAVPFHQVILIFDKQEHLNQMQLKDELGQTTVLYFTDLKLNASVAKNSFTFEVPKGIDVIRNP
ncbi:MAG: outer membrane lipoprotein chaperone LolA [Gammaproteobacteria bacterium]|nr:outer membrane lipoprotein chaperone LolA [Gammaproteobacteria bacterium]